MTKRTDSLKWFTAITVILSSVAVPIVIAKIGGEYNLNIKDSENRVRYVELAIALLRAPPTPESSALRGWAIELLNNQAPVHLSDKAKEQLQSKPLPIELSGAAVAHSAGRANLTTGRLE